MAERAFLRVLPEEGQPGHGPLNHSDEWQLQTLKQNTPSSDTEIVRPRSDERKGTFSPIRSAVGTRLGKMIKFSFIFCLFLKGPLFDHLVTSHLVGI